MNAGEDKVIETDEDTRLEDKRDNDGGIYPYDPTFTDIEIGEAPYTIFEYLRKLEQGKIITQPDFQRNLVWSNEKKSKFIESIILNFPIPPIYLNETIEGKSMIIDGLQRTTALQEFYKGQFELSDLEALPKYNEKSFSDLPEALQSKFEDKKLTIFVLKPSTPMVVIYDLFNRINTGGTQLNRQEVRNCIYIGKSTRTLKELSELTVFREAINEGIKSTRMKDRETVLRYIAFKWFDYQNEYSNEMSEYVESAMKRMNKMSDEEINEIKKDFARVMKWSFDIWGDSNFRIPTEHTRGTINTAVLEAVCNYISCRDDNFLKKNRNIIKQNYSTLIDDGPFYEAVTRSTGNKAKVLTRFRLAHMILDQNTSND